MRLAAVAYGVAGANACGKSNFVERFRDGDRFTPSHHLSGQGDLFVKNVTHPDGSSTKLRIFDTTGCSRWEPLISCHLQTVAVAVLCYSVVSRHSFEDAGRFLTLFRPEGLFGIVVVGLLPQGFGEVMRSVTEEEGQAYAASLGAHFFEADAYSGRNTAAPFQVPLQMLLSAVRCGEVTSAQRGISLEH